MVLTHFAATIGNHLMVVFKDHNIFTIGQHFHDDALHFDQLFFSHFVSNKLKEGYAPERAIFKWRESLGGKATPLGGTYPTSQKHKMNVADSQYTKYALYVPIGMYLFLTQQPRTRL